MKLNEKITITKRTASRIANYCKAVESGISYPKIPDSPYMFDELVGNTTEEKVNFYKEVKLAFNNKQPTRKNIRRYAKIYKEFGDSHFERMETIYALLIDNMVEV